MKPSELLIKAQAVIADPRRWTQDVYAKDAEGQVTKTLSPDAACWCSLGALEKVAHEENTYITRLTAAGYLAVVSDKYGYSGITDLNDNLSHETVMKAWDKAIKLAKEDGK